MDAEALAQLTREIVDNAPDAIMYCDAEGIIRYWNDGASQLFGYPASEALGRSLDLIIPERLRGRHWEGYARSMATGSSRYGRELLSVPALHRDGRSISVEFSIVMVRGGDNRPLGVAAIMRDVTERFAREKALKQRLAELEAS